LGIARGEKKKDTEWNLTEGNPSLGHGGGGDKKTKALSKEKPKAS